MYLGALYWPDQMGRRYEAAQNTFVNQISSYTTSSFAPAANSIGSYSKQTLATKISHHPGEWCPGAQGLSYLYLYKRVCFGKACNLIDE